MSQQSLTVKCAGLWTYPSDLADVPPGSLSQADNIVIDRDGIAEPHRGFGYMTHGSSVQSVFSDPTYRANKVFFYQGQILCHYASNLLAYHNATSGWTNYSGTYSPPSGTVKVRSAQANQNLYLTTAAGVQKLDAYGNTPSAVGVPAALDLAAAISSSGSTWLANNFRSAWRLVWGIKDANNNVLSSAPSQRVALTNTSGVTKAIDLTFTIPQGITTAHFYQLYRAASTDNTSTVVEPSDEMGLVYEGNPSSGDLSTGTITITDVVPDTLIGATLYTSPSQGGIANANYLPPAALDLAVFRNSLFYANTTSFQTFTITLLGVGSPNGVQTDDTLTVGGVVFTAKGSETIASGQFKVVTGGSASQNVRDTSLSLCRVINRYASSTVYAYYLSAANDLPGKIMLQARTAGQAAFTISASRSLTYNPDVGAASQTSTNDAFKNCVFYSKTSEPEAVPLANFILVGSGDKAILRILPLRDSLFILKEDGVFRIYGTDPTNFQVSPLDFTAILIAPDSAVVINNQIYALTTQGVVAISETGVQIMSHPVERDILSLITQNYATLQTATFGVAYESARAYYLWVISSGADTTPTQAFRYNYITNAWTRVVLAKTCGGVNPVDDKLYLGNAANAFVDVERKTLTYSDYADFSSTQTISAVNGNVIAITSSDTIAVGSVIYQSATVFGTVASVDPVSGNATMTLPVAFALAAADVLAPIQCAMTWLPVTLANPGLSKHIREVALLFKSDFNGVGTVTFLTDVSPAGLSETISGGTVGGWGLFAWGGPFDTPQGAPWGGDNRRRPIRVSVPRNHRRSSILILSFSHAYGFSPWLLQGVSLIGDPVSERVAN